VVLGLQIKAWRWGKPNEMPWTKRTNLDQPLSLCIPKRLGKANHGCSLFEIWNLHILNRKSRQSSYTTFFFGKDDVRRQAKHMVQGSKANSWLFLNRMFQRPTFNLVLFLLTKLLSLVLTPAECTSKKESAFLLTKSMHRTWLLFQQLSRPE
jgi:hypothetical protein